jgi:hypothetical protein
MDTVDVDDLELIEVHPGDAAGDLRIDPSRPVPAQGAPAEFDASEFSPATSTGVAEPAIVDDGLTDRERQVLAFERQWWKHAGSKEQAIRDMFDVSSTRYYQMVNTLLDNPAALEYDPVLVKRLRRLRATRARARTGGR